MPAKIKIRSVSVEDLGNIVKQMIDGVLEDNERVAKLHQAVFEEYYFKKMEELKQVKAKIDADYRLNQEAEHFKTDTFESKVLHSSYKFEIGDSQPRDVDTVEASIECDNVDHLLSDDKMNDNALDDSSRYEASIIDLSKSTEHLNSQETDEKGAKNSFVNDPPVIHVMRRPKYVRVGQEAGFEDTKTPDSNIALGLANHNTTIDLTQATNKTISHTGNNNEQVQSERNVSSIVEILEWRSNSLKQRVPESNPNLGKTREIPVQFKSKGEIAFENWKKEKTSTYHRVIREEQKKKHLEQTAKAKQIEKKEAANEAYLYWRRQQNARQKLINRRKRILAQMESQKLESSEKRIANHQAFKAWKRQKDIKLRERKIYMMAYGQQSNSQHQAKPQKPKPGVRVAFDMWLDQLDGVLHQKYLRERRYLVHSFYCQPAYFGTAALCT